jgi:hypothetical protein
MADVLSGAGAAAAVALRAMQTGAKLRADSRDERIVGPPAK